MLINEVINLKKNRVSELDILKGIAIFLVVWGHSIQYLSPSQLDYYNNIVFRFIYSFHMPLFMIVSGYLFYTSVNKKNFFDTFMNKFRKILLPGLLLGFIIGIVEAIINHSSIVSGGINGLLLYWFLIAVFLFSVGFKFIHDYMHDSTIIYIVLCIITFFVPVYFGAPYLYTYSFFMIGYLFNKYHKNNINTSISLFIFVLIIFIVSLILYNNDSFIFVSKNYIFNPEYNMYRIIPIRFVAALTGTYLLLAISKLIIKIPYFSLSLIKLGENSLFIYILQRIIIEEIIPIMNIKIPFALESYNILYDLLTLLVAIVSIVICYYANKLLKKTSVWRALFNIN